MTVNEDNKLISEMVALLAKAGISAQDCELAETYLNGQAGDEVLDQFERKDLMTISRQLVDEAKKITEQVKRSRTRKTCVRFFNVVYAIGHDTCQSLFWYNAFDREETYELDKRIVLYIAIHIESPGCLFHDEYSCLLRMVQDQPENLLEVLPSLRKEGGLYAAAALAAYFGRKYETPGEVLAEDAVLMEEYEEIILRNFDEWLAEQGCITHQEAIAAIREKRQAGTVIGRIEISSSNTKEGRRFQFITSLAYLNYQLSDVLLAVVRTSAAVNAEVMLDSMGHIYIGDGGSRTDIACRGMDYDGLFSIEPGLYICWAARARYDQILVRQLEKNQESYLKVMEREECRRLVHICMRAYGWEPDNTLVLDSAEDVLTALKDVMQNANPSLYEQTVKSAKPDYEPMIRKLVADTPHAELAREYLRGNCRFSELIPYDEEFGDGFASVYYSMKPIVQKFRKHCYDPEFINRCRAFLVLRKYQRVKYDTEDDILSGNDDLDPFFTGLDSEQVGLAYQLQAFSLIYKEVPKSASNYDAVTGNYVKSAEKIFSKFLKENQGETIKVFARADPEGRYLGLHILGKEPQKYKKEILGYAKDSSSLVLYELRRILCGQKDWEDDVRTLLNGKKASERELAIQVFLKWQEEGMDCDALLSQALAAEKSAKLVTLLQRELKRQGKYKSDTSM